MQSVKRENQALIEQIRLLRLENDTLRNQVKGFKDQERTFEEKQKQISIFQERIKVLEGLGHDPKVNTQQITINKVQRQSSQKKVASNTDYMGKTQSEVNCRQLLPYQTSASQTIDNSAFGANKRTDYFKVKIEIENSKESQRKKNTSLHYQPSYSTTLSNLRERPQSMIREKKSQTVHQPYKINQKQYASGNGTKPFMSNPSSINNSIHIVSNYQNLVKSRQSEQRQPISIGNWTHAKKIIGSRPKQSNTINHNDISKNSKVSQDYSEFLEEFNNA